MNNLKRSTRLQDYVNQMVPNILRDYQTVQEYTNMYTHSPVNYLLTAVNVLLLKSKDRPVDHRFLWECILSFEPPQYMILFWSS